METVNGVKRFIVCCFFLSTTFWLARCAQDGQCGRNPKRIMVTSVGDVLYSPGYPESYPNSVSCSWLLISKELGKVLQLQPLDLRVGRKSPGDRICSGDVITAYDGDSTSSSVLHAWCGDDVSLVHSSSASVLLTLTTNHRRRYRGFAIKYSLLTLSDNSCEVDVVKTIPLQDVAVVVDFSPPPSSLHTHLPSTCTWRLAADDVNSQVVIDLERFNNGLPCEAGNFSVYDGPETSSPEVIRWCARNTKPFTSIYLSSHQGMVVIRMKPNLTPVLRFRFYTRPKLFSACSLSHMPALELKGDDPVYISFPFAVSDSGGSCPVHLLSGVTRYLWARVDLLKANGQTARCAHVQVTDPLTILQANETSGNNGTTVAVHAICWRGHHPVYWPVAESVIVSPPKDSRGLVIRVTAGDGVCHGQVKQVKAPTEEAIAIKYPPPSTRTLEYSRSTWCRYVVSGKGEGDHVLCRVEGELCELADHCGDYIRIYDGPSTEYPLLYDSRSKNHVTVYTISTGRHMMFEFSTDDQANRGFVQAEFNSVPDSKLCGDIQRIKASRQPQNLTSINYPQYYPINYMCQYCITSDNPDEVIYIQVIDSDMTYTCSDSVEVYDGADSDTDSEYLGRFCGQDRPRFVSKQPGMCLLFRSDPRLHGRGWMLSYRAASPVVADHNHEGSGNFSSSSSTTATAVVALVVLLAVIVIFVIYIVKNKRRDRRSSA